MEKPTKLPTPPELLQGMFLQVSEVPVPASGCLREAEASGFSSKADPVIAPGTIVFDIQEN